MNNIEKKGWVSPTIEELDVSKTEALQTGVDSFGGGISLRGEMPGGPIWTPPS